MDNDSIDGKAEYASSEYSNEIPPPVSLRNSLIII